MKYYEYRHQTGFEETNVVGNVYYVNHLRWQGRCRELFLKEKAPDILDELNHDLALSTVRCSCEYFDELWAFDEIIIRMSLHKMLQNRIVLNFEYIRTEGNQTKLVARGSQEIACMRREGKRATPTPIPKSLREALEPYQS